MSKNSDYFYGSNIDSENLKKSVKEFINDDNPTDASITINHDENRTKISKIESFIIEKYELRINSVISVLEVKEIGIDTQFEKAERFEADITVALFKAGFKGFKSELIAYLGSNCIPQYHPIKEYFKHLPQWDNVDRIGQYASCLRCENKCDVEPLRINLTKHLIRCVASVFKKGYFNKQCFVIVGTKQNVGKTSFIRGLVPESLKSYTTDAVLDWKDKDSNISLVSNWIINLDELANLDKSDTNSLKAALSRSYIKFRRPFDRLESEIPRLANFFGSTNDLQFLGDLTGNVRWVCFRISEIDFKYSEIDIDQLWAQAYSEFIRGTKYDLTREELQQNEERNMEFMVINQERDAILNHLLPASKNQTHPELLIQAKFASAGELMKYLNQNKGYGFKSIANFGKALTSCGFQRTSERTPFRTHPCYGYWYFKIEQGFENSEYPF